MPSRKTDVLTGQQELTYSERMFVFYYVMDNDTIGNGRQSAKSAYGIKDDNLATERARELLNKPEIQQEIDRRTRLRPENLTTENIKLAIAEDAFYSPSATVRARSKELLAKVNGLIIDKSQVTIDANIKQLSINLGDGLGVLSALRERIMYSAQGKLTSEKKAPERPKLQKPSAENEALSRQNTSPPIENNAESQDEQIDDLLSDETNK